MKKVDKVNCGEMLLYLNRTVNPKLRHLQTQIVDNACNARYLACENTLVQIKYILRDIERKSNLMAISNKLADSLNKLSKHSRGMINFLSIRDLDAQNILRKDIYSKFKYKTDYYRAIDKALSELTQYFFEDCSLTEFIEKFKSEPLVQNSMKYASGEKTCSRRNEKNSSKHNAINSSAEIYRI